MISKIVRLIVVFFVKMSKYFSIEKKDRQEDASFLLKKNNYNERFLWKIMKTDYGNRRSSDAISVATYYEQIKRTKGEVYFSFDKFLKKNYFILKFEILFYRNSNFYRKSAIH